MPITRSQTRAAREAVETAAKVDTTGSLQAKTTDFKDAAKVEQPAKKTTTVKKTTAVKKTAAKKASAKKASAQPIQPEATVIKDETVDETTEPAQPVQPEAMATHKTMSEQPAVKKEEEQEGWEQKGAKEEEGVQQPAVEEATAVVEETAVEAAEHIDSKLSILRALAPVPAPASSPVPVPVSVSFPILAAAPEIERWTPELAASTSQEAKRLFLGRARAILLLRDSHRVIEPVGPAQGGRPASSADRRPPPPANKADLEDTTRSDLPEGWVYRFDAIRNRTYYVDMCAPLLLLSDGRPTEVDPSACSCLSHSTTGLTTWQRPEKLPEMKEACQRDSIGLRVDLLALRLEQDYRDPVKRAAYLREKALCRAVKAEERKAIRQVSLLPLRLLA